MPKRSRRWQRVRNAWPRHAATIGRAALDVFVAIKRRDPLYGGMAIFSTYEAVNSLLDSTTSVEAAMARRGFERAFVGLEYFIWYTAKQLNCPMETVSELFGEGAKRSLLRVELAEDVELYGALSNGALTDVYAKDERIAAGALIQHLSHSVGDCWLVALRQAGWEVFPALQPLAMTDECFVVGPEEQELVESLQKFDQAGVTNRSALICGPPGVGKTTMSWRVAKALGGSLLVVDAACLDHMCRNAMGQKPLELLLRALKPSVLLLDDIERMEEGHIKRLLGFMARLRQQRGLRTFGTANSLKDLPHALCRPERFDDIVELAPPGPEDRFRIVRGYCAVYGTRLCDSYMQELVEMTEGLTGAYLKEIARQAFILKWEQLKPKIRRISTMARRLAGAEKGGEPTSDNPKSEAA